MKAPMKTANLVQTVTGNLTNMKQYCYKFTYQCPIAEGLRNVM